MFIKELSNPFDTLPQLKQWDSSCETLMPERSFPLTSNGKNLIRQSVLLFRLLLKVDDKTIQYTSDIMEVVYQVAMSAAVVLKL